MEPTLDPQVFIEARGEGSVTYRHVGTGERWTIRGTCNRCGECEVGSTNPDILWVVGKQAGEPGACIDLAVARGRPDNVVRPEYSSPSCTLSGEYL